MQPSADARHFAPSAPARAIAADGQPPPRTTASVGWVDRSGLSFLRLRKDPSFNGPEYLRHFSLYHVVVESDELNTETFQSAMSFEIGVALLPMADAIDFNREHQVRTEEIDYESVDRLLPVK